MKMGDMTSKRSRTAGVVYRVPQKKVTLGIAGTSTASWLFTIAGLQRGLIIIVSSQLAVEVPCPANQRVIFFWHTLYCEKTYL